MRIRVGFALIVVLAGAVVGRAQDVASGPAKGEKIPALKVFDATGVHQDKEVDYAAERKDKPTVYVLLRADKFDRPMNRFLKGLDKIVKKDFAGAYVVAVWLTENEAGTKELLPRVQQSVKYEATALTCFSADKTGPKGWGINTDAHITVVVASKGRVATVSAYRSINETDVPAVRDAVKKAWAKK